MHKNQDTYENDINLDIKAGEIIEIEVEETQGLDGKDGKNWNDGIDGVDGKAGIDGKDWKDGEMGMKGDKWDKWDKGDKWEQGEQWKDGKDGTDWKDGEKWEPWEKGDKWDRGPEWKKGDPGRPGSDGPRGIGVIGPPGPSAYEIAVNNGFIGTVQEWTAGIRIYSTALVTPAVMTINTDPTKFDIPSFKAIFVDSYTNLETPTLKNYTYPGSTGITATNIAIWDVTYISIDVLGNIYQTQTNPSGADSRDRVCIGSLVHTSHTQIDFIDEFINTVGFDLPNSIGDLSNSIGIINKGNIFSANGTNLKINKSAGHSMQIGLNWSNSKKTPNITDDNPLIAPSFIYSWRNGGAFNSIITSDIIPGRYDDNTGGILQPNGIVQNNKWSVQKIYYSPEVEIVAIEFWQSVYASLAEAETSLTIGTIVNSALAGLSFRGWIIVKWNATNLSDSTQAAFINANKFGDASGGGSSTGSSTTTIQGTYDNSVTPEINTDAIRGAFSVKENTGNNSNLVFEWKNNAWTTTFSVDGNGNIVANNLPSGPTVSESLVIAYSIAL